MYIIEFSKNLLTLLPDFEALSGSNYILKHKTLPILLYPSVSPTPNWEPPLNVNIANTQKHVKRLLFKLSELPMLEEFKGDNGGYVYTRKIDFLSPEAVDVSLAGFSDSLFGIAERVRALNGIINIYNLWYNNKMNEEKILQEQLEKTQNALAEKNTKRV